jgi:hypothetical protein
MNLNRLHLIEQELEALQKLVWEATCNVYTLRHAQSAQIPLSEWLEIRRLNFHEPSLNHEKLSQERIMFRAQELAGIAGIKLEMIERQFSKLTESAT